MHKMIKLMNTSIILDKFLVIFNICAVDIIHYIVVLHNIIFEIF